MPTYRVLLPHPLEPRVLLMHAHGDWRLPEWEDPAQRDWRVTDHVSRAVAARFGMETTVLRCVRVERAGERETRVYELENHSAAHDAVPAATWVGRTELAMLPVAEADTRALLEQWFARDSGEVPLTGAPWVRRGWYVEALSWAVARLGEVGAVLQAAPEQLQASELALLMRFRTDIGTFFFKAVPALSQHEPALMQWLAGRYPLNLPDIVATDRDRGWLLHREVTAGGTPLDEVREEEEWYLAVRRLAEIQLDCVHRTRELRALGCPNRGLEFLARRLPRLCGDTAALMGAATCGLDRQQMQHITALTPTLLTLCEELASYDIPDSIEHGELHPHNVVSTLAGPVFLGWSNASLSHPFFSMSHLMTAAISLLPATSRESRRRLRDSYLAPWSGTAAPETLVRAFEIARVLAPVHLAAAAHAELLPGAAHRWEVECVVPEHMKMALRLLADSESPVSIAQQNP